jgi:hypothetical protein
MNAPANLLQHALSAAFPRPSAAEFEALKDSINVIGVQVPITIFDGQVIDGWSRYSAATELGMDCPMVELGGTDPHDFAKSQAARRNLTPSQTAMVIVEIYKWKPAHRPVNHTLNVCLSDNSTLKVDLTKSSAELASIAGVHINSITRAKTVQTNAVPEVVAAVKNGDVGLPKAAAIAKLPKAEQAAALTKPLPKLHQHVQDVALHEAPPDEPEDFGPDADELAAQAAAEQADRATMQLLLDSDNALATAVTEIKRLKAEMFLLKQSRDAAMNRANELTKWVSKRDYQIAKMNEDMAALKRGAA